MCRHHYYQTLIVQVLYCYRMRKSFPKICLIALTSKHSMYQTPYLFKCLSASLVVRSDEPNELAAEFKVHCLRGHICILILIVSRLQLLCLISSLLISTNPLINHNVGLKISQSAELCSISPNYVKRPGLEHVTLNVSVSAFLKHDYFLFSKAMAF